MSISEQYQSVAQEVARVCESCGRDPNEVVLVAVSKTVGPDGVAQAFEAGARTFGENRPEQIMEKQPLFPEASWHFIGNIQSRRIKDIVAHASLIHSVYEPRHLMRIENVAAERDKIQDILIEVNVSGEESKGGVPPEGVLDLLRATEELAHVRVRGLMTMAPQGDLVIAQETFKDLRTLAESLRKAWQSPQAGLLSELSMGMSEDWRQAIAEGATIVRIGRAIFSDQFIE